MKLLSDSHSKRNAALVAVVLWMFAFAAGVANACLLEAHGTDFHAESSKVVGGEAALDHTHVHPRTAGSHDQQEHSKAPCQKFCDDESRLLIKQNHGVDQPDIGPTPLVAVLWTLTEASSVEPLHVEAMLAVAPTVPLRLRYARLAL